MMVNILIFLQAYLIYYNKHFQIILKINFDFRLAAS